MKDQEKLDLKLKIAETFTPSAPIDNADIFSGRKYEITRLLNAVAQKGQHAILFGERGVGKTSLANVLRDVINSQQKSEYLVVRTNCATSATFGSIWENIFSQIQLHETEIGMGFRPPEHDVSFKFSLSASPSPEEVRLAIGRIHQKSIFIIDELDRVGPEVSAGIADTIKTLSDNSADCTLILVGVGDDVDTLVHNHKSVQRALIEIPMPRMKPSELADIVNKGLHALKMTILETPLKRISNLSHGLPHYTHALALHAAQSAVDRDLMAINDIDVESAIRLAIDNAERSVVSNYSQATTSPRGNLYPEVLLACALAEIDELGYFRAVDVRGPMSQIMGRKYEIPAFSQHLNDFCDKKRGKILEKTGWRKRFRFRFVTPLMEPYVLMKGLLTRKINPEIFDAKLDQPVRPSNETERLL